MTIEANASSSAGRPPSYRRRVPAARRVCLTRWLACALILIGTAEASAQPGPAPDSISFDAALARFLRHNPRFQESRARARRLAAETRLPLVLPNPTLGAEDETAASEQSLTVEQAIPNPFARKALSGAADAARREVAAEYLEEVGDLYLEFRLRYLDASIARMHLDVLGPITRTVVEAFSVAEVRLEEGDLGPFDLQRLRLAADEYEDALEEARAESETAHAALAVLIAADTAGFSNRFVVVDSLHYEPASFDEPVLVERGLSERPSVVAARARLESLQQALNAARRSRWSGFSVTAGIGREVEPEGSSVGPTVGLGVDLPIWDRNGVRIQMAQAHVEEAAAALEAERRSVRLEIEAALLRLRSYRTRIDRLGLAASTDADALLPDALFLYEEGEIGLVELLDAADAARSSRLLRLMLLQGYLESRYELERALGVLPDELHTAVTAR